MGVDLWAKKGCIALNSLARVLTDELNQLRIHEQINVFCTYAMYLI